MAVKYFIIMYPLEIFRYKIFLIKRERNLKHQINLYNIF